MTSTIYSPPSEHDMEGISHVEDAAMTMLHIRDIEIAASRLALIPCATRRQAEQAKAIPVTRGMGINIASSIRQMAQIAATSGGNLFTTAEKCKGHKGRKRYSLRIWRIPT